MTHSLYQERRLRNSQTSGTGWSTFI